MLINLPRSLLRRRDIRFELASRTISPGVTASGVIPLSRTDGGGLWTMDAGEIQLSTANHRRAWRAISGLCDGGVNKLIVPFHDPAHQPWPIVNGEPLEAHEEYGFDDGTLFDDGVGFWQPVIVAKAVGAWAERATTVRLEIEYGGEIESGEHFSVEHPIQSHRPYRIVQAIEVGAGVYDVTIRPPLREAVVDETALDFDEPKCIMQPVEPNGLDIVTDIINLAQPSVQLVEGWTPEMIAALIAEDEEE